jgi:hypothetical protein
MAIFSFTAGGKSFDVEAPSGATEAQAKAVFDKQFNTGSLTGLVSGDILNAATQAKDGLKSALSQLGPNATSAINALSTQLPNLSNVSISAPINVGSFVTQAAAQVNIGGLNPTQIQGLLTSTSASVGQAAAALTSAKGLGAFGFNAKQLEQTGMLKPGTAKILEQSGADLASTLSSPAVWTGKGGVNSVTDILGNDKLQSGLQQTLMKQGFDKLGQLGSITKNLDPAKLGPIVSNAAKFGADTASKWLSGGASAAVVGQLNDLAKNSQFGQAFSALNDTISGGGSPLQAGVKELKGFANTVNRDTVTQGTKNVIGNSKVPSPSFSPPPKIPKATKEDLIAQSLALSEEKKVLDLEYTNIYNRTISAFTNSQVDVLGPGIIADAQALSVKLKAYLPKITAFVATLEAQLNTDLYASNYSAKLVIESTIDLIEVIIAKIQKRIDAIKAGG